MANTPTLHASMTPGQTQEPKAIRHRPRRYDILPLPEPIGLDAEQAAAFVGLSMGKFLEGVADGRFPAPREFDGRRIYDVDELRTAFKSLPKKGEQRNSRNGAEGFNEWDQA